MEKTKKKTKIVYAGASFLLLNGNGYQTGRVRDKDRLVSFVMWAQPQKEFKLAVIWVLTKLQERYHKLFNSLTLVPQRVYRAVISSFVVPPLNNETSG